MNKEKYNQIMMEAYENYQKEMLYHPEDNWLDDGNDSKCYRQLTKEEFINRIKTDNEFSEKWGLKIEERELSLDERDDLFYKQYKSSDKKGLEYEIEINKNLPTKLITITYKNETIESYE